MSNPKLHPRRFKEASPKMVAIVGYILGERFTDPSIEDMIVTVDGFVLAQHEGDIGFNDFMGAESDLVRNWNNYLDAAGLTPEERGEAERLFKEKVRKA